MSTLNAFNLYSYLQRSIAVTSNSSSSFATLLLQAHRKLTFNTTTPNTNNNKKTNVTVATATKNSEKHRQYILYPGRTSILPADLFFSCPKSIIKQQEQQQQRKRRLAVKRKKLINNISKDIVESIKKQSVSGHITPHYRAPREPIVLCHGLFGFDVRGPENIPALQFHYWSGVEDALAKLGAKIIVTKVPQAGSIWERSHALHTILKSILVGKNVNFVAHSMGGLDCRHLLANIQDKPYRVQSLTTICTPHRGSPVMDWFRDHVGLGLANTPNHQFASSNSNNTNWSPSSTAILSTKNGVQQQRGTTSISSSVDAAATTSKWTSKLPSFKGSLDKIVIDWFDEPAYAHLTTDFCNDYFNPNTPDDPNVQYYSYGAAAKIPAYSSLLNLPWQMVNEKEGDNDGIVSVKSAKWGTYVKTIEADHWDLSGKSRVPYRFRTTKEFDRPEFYAEMATHLYNQGH